MLFEKSKGETLKKIRQDLEGVCQTSGRPSHCASLLAVTKNQSAEAILPFLQAGHREFGENRVQEAAIKWPLLRQKYPDVRLHLIGPLQTNKVKQALELFDVIESVDRPQLVCALAKVWNHPARLTTKILIQVNTGREPQKSGVLVDDLPSLVNLCRRYALPLTGLMVIPPLGEDPAPHFHLLAGLAKNHNLPDLSMGMSNDYPLAIAQGATWVRIGRALWV